jgi:LacI family transcriptional regulator
MPKKVTLDDLSEQLKLSKFSVSRALSGKPGVSEQTREQVVQVARQLGYNHTATLPAASERVVHLIIPRADAIHSSFWIEVIAGAEAEAKALGFRLTVDVMGGERGTEIIEDKTSALILAGRRSRGVMEPFLKLPIPKVMIGHPRPMEMVDSVQTANFDAGFAVGQLLGRLGHRRIAFFTDAPEDEGRNLRVAGLTEGMREFPDARIEQIHFNSEDDASSIALDALRSTHRPTAFSAATDFVAITLAWGLLEAGLRVPQHVSVIGSNDSHTASQLGLRLTTVRQPMQEIGAAAIQMLQWRLDKAGPSARPRRTLLTPEMIERTTHGPCNPAALEEALAQIELGSVAPRKEPGGGRP